MSHTHPVADPDPHFTINSETRAVVNTSADKLVLMQYDHGSEICSFDIPKFVEEHDMTQCNSIKIHFINIANSKNEKNTGVYDVTDFGVSDSDPEKCTFTWTINDTATQYAGTLTFLIQFACIDESGKVTYRWSTDVNNTIIIKNGIDNGSEVIEPYPDVLAQWQAEIDAALAQLDVGYVRTINGQAPDENGNVEIEIGCPAGDTVLYTEQTLTEAQQTQARENIGAASEEAVKGSSLIYEAITPTIETGYRYLDNGTKSASSTTACTEVIPVKSGDKFLITSAYGWANILLVEFDENGTFVNYVGKSPDGATVVTDYEYTVPDGVFGIAVSTYLNSKYPISMKKGVYGSIADDIAKNTADIASHNTSHRQRICTNNDWLGGKADKGFTYDLNSTIGLVIELLKKATFDEDVKSKIEALENSIYPDALKLSSSLTTGTYTLAYIDANGNEMAADYLPICEFTVDSAAQKIAYNGFIAENVAPKTATKIGIFDENTINRDMVGEIALGLFSATRHYAHLSPEYSFVAISDTHVGEEGAADDFESAVHYINAAVDGEFTVICGDCVDDATDTTQLQEYYDIATLSIKPIFVVMGNHESVNMDVSGKDVDISGNYASISQYFGTHVYETKTINQELYYSFEKNGDVFIMAGAYGNYNYDRTFSDEELQWLYETLEANRNKRCFLFHHYFPKNGSGDAVNCYAKNDGLRGYQGDIFYRLLRHYKNVIYFHGHSHAKFNAQELNRYNTIDKEYGMYSIHIPSLTKPKYPNATQDEYLPDWEAGEGYIVDVYSNGVHLKGRDFEQSKYTPIASYWLPTTLREIEAGTFYDPTGTIVVE